MLFDIPDSAPYTTALSRIPGAYDGPPSPGARWPDRWVRAMEEDGIGVTEEEYLRARQQVSREGSCRMSYALLQRREDPDTIRIQPLLCGQRRCQGCGELARRYARRRIATSEIYHFGIEWRQFWTLTMPRDARASAMDAWKEMGAILSKVLRIYKRWVSKMKLYDAPLHYAWVLEAHEDGWPHVHIVMSMPYPTTESGELRLVRAFRHIWNKWWGFKWSIVQLEKPRNAKRAGDYLTKYIGKMHQWPEALYAVMYRRRSWASTLPMLPTLITPPPVWQVQEVVSLTQATRILRSWRYHGWKVIRDSEGMVGVAPGGSAPGGLLEGDGIQEEPREELQESQEEERRVPHWSDAWRLPPAPPAPPGWVRKTEAEGRAKS